MLTTEQIRYIANQYLNAYKMGDGLISKMVYDVVDRIFKTVISQSDYYDELSASDTVINKPTQVTALTTKNYKNDYLLTLTRKQLITIIREMEKEISNRISPQELCDLVKNKRDF